MEPGLINNRERILAHWNEFQEKLAAADIALKVIPGCDMPLSFESLQLLEEGQVLTLNDGQGFLLLELPNVSFPPAIEEIFFCLQTISLLHLGGHFLKNQLPLQKGDNMEDIPENIISGEPGRQGGTGAGGG